MQPRSIIVLTREHIGDLICTTPALRALRHLYPEAHIAVEVGERAACVLENSPYLDEIILRPDRQGLSGKARFIGLLRRRRFDLGVILDDCADMLLYLYLGGVPRRVGVARKKRFARLFTASVPYDPQGHEMIDNFRNVVALLGGATTDASTEVFPAPTDIQVVEDLFREEEIRPGERLIGLNPGASSPANRWPPERFAELADLLAERRNTRILLLGGPGDRDIVRAIRASMQTIPVTLTGRLTVLQLAEVLRRCELVVTGDTGPMHLALAVKTPVVALFGPAVPSESGPGYMPGNRVIRKVDGCPGCLKSACQHEQRCMRAITAVEVAAAVDEMLQKQDGALASV